MLWNLCCNAKIKDELDEILAKHHAITPKASSPLPKADSLDDLEQILENQTAAKSLNTFSIAAQGK